MPWLIGKPVLLELHRADIGQRRVQPSLVVPEQPVDDFVLGLTSGLEGLSMQPLDHQRPEQRLATGVDAPMSSKGRSVFQIGQDERVQLTNDVALQTAVNLLLCKRPAVAS